MSEAWLLREEWYIVDGWQTILSQCVPQLVAQLSQNGTEPNWYSVYISANHADQMADDVRKESLVYSRLGPAQYQGYSECWRANI